MIRENKAMEGLTGQPRWWTMTNKQGTREIVRVCFKRGRDYHGDDKPDEVLLFVSLPPGAFAFPPLIVGALKLGGAGFDRVRDLGGKVWPYDSDTGRKLELMLCGVR